jgi:hypothetical protein
MTPAEYIAQAIKAARQSRRAAQHSGDMAAVVKSSDLLIALHIAARAA